ncbi:hypothetical protein ACWDX6_24110 [Streptomyces sp. NPDC003027]
MTEPFKTATEYRAARAKEAEKAQQRRALMEAGGWAVIFVVFSPLEAWLLMLVLGAIHGVFAPVAAVGYGTALLFLLGVDLAGWWAGRFRRSK